MAQIECPKCGGYKVHSGMSELGCLGLLIWGGITIFAGIMGVATGQVNVVGSAIVILVVVGAIVYWLWDSSASAECRICGYKWKLR